MKKALKKIAVMVTIVALTMGNSVLSAAESGFSTQFEVASEIKSCVEGSYIIHA